MLTCQHHLKGDYRTSTFTAASDGHGGVIIHDPPSLSAPLPPWIVPDSSQRFIAAMAGLGDGAAGYLNPATAEPWRGAHSMLGSPQTHFA